MKVLLVAYPGAQAATLYGLRDFFEAAARIAEAEIGVEVIEDLANADVTGDAVIMLPPALSDTPPDFAEGFLSDLRAFHAAGATVASICAGAFAVAAAGLADGRQMTTHWRHHESFAARFPDVDLKLDRLLVDDGDIISAAGVMAWTDLALYLIEGLHGRHVMLEVARLFVVDPQGREQQYFRRFRPAYAHGDTAIRDLQRQLQREPGTDWTVTQMARDTAMSERSLLRRFRAATGMAPSEYLRQLRVARAREMLETSRDTVDQVAYAVGYDDTGGFRRAFRSIVGLSPSDYRQRFGPLRKPHA